MRINIKRMKRTITYLIFVIIGVLVGFFAEVLFQNLGENTVEALQSTIQADAALIGFLAIIIVFVLTETSHAHKTIIDQINRCEDSHKQIVERGMSDNVEHSAYKKDLERLTYFAGLYMGFSDVALFASIVGATFFVISILFAALGMSANPILRNLGVEVCISAMVLGITSIFYTLDSYKGIQEKYIFYEVTKED
jgi:uncharacterized protein YacL